LAQKLFPESRLFLYPRGSLIVEQGETGRDIFVVQSGGVSIAQASGAEMARLGPGELFGEMALFKEGARTANAVAAEDSRIFRVLYSDVHFLFKFNPVLTDHLKQLASRRLDPQPPK
jgi:voltage-gated potassium channel